MLEESRELYENSAKLYIDNWKSIDKNDLIRDAVKYAGTTKYDSYVSAVMLRYWGKMGAYYQRCKLVATPEDVHMWLTQAVLYAIERHPWTNPKSSIYEDENGPDKVVNRVLESKRLTFYQQLNRYNRKVNSAILSLDALSEDMLDTYTPMCEDDHTFIIDDLVIRAFNVKDYFVAFLVDAIVSEGYKTGGRHKRIVTHLKHLDSHCDVFACRYDLNLETVQKASTYITRLSRSMIKHKIDVTLSDMKRSIIKEQSGMCDDIIDCSTLYGANKIIEYYYVELWDSYEESEGV